MNNHNNSDTISNISSINGNNIDYDSILESLFAQLETVQNKIESISLKITKTNENNSNLHNLRVRQQELELEINDLKKYLGLTYNDNTKSIELHSPKRTK